MYNIRHKKEERAELDYYSTDPDSVRALLAVEKFNTNILEPACGGGAISETLKQVHYCVKSSDLVPRGYGEVKDFFKGARICFACFKNGISKPVGGPAVAYAWFVWLKGSKTEPILRWLN
jgi:hypothetical protein